MTPDWDTLYMSMAHLVAMKSKDLSTRVGAVIVDDLNIVRGMGYNGFPRNINKTADRLSRKNDFTIHAERNALMNTSSPVRGCKMYVNFSPCNLCALHIIQEGLTEVIIHREFNLDGHWGESQAEAKEMMSEAGILLREWSGDILTPVGLRAGQTIDLTTENNPCT